MIKLSCHPSPTAPLSEAASLLQQKHSTLQPSVCRELRRTNMAFTGPKSTGYVLAPTKACLIHQDWDYPAYIALRT